jgi:hypothetical protein
LILPKPELETALAPIILFVYNRPWHTRQTVESLLKSKLSANSELFIFSDGPKTGVDIEKVKQVRTYIHQITGFRRIEIMEKETNTGLANSVIEGVTQVIHNYGKAIVLEDDMVFATNFLSFMNDALYTYTSQQHIFSISGYSYPISIPAYYKQDVYLLPRASSWGWATWADRWRQVDWQVSDFDQFVKNKSLVNAFVAGGEDLLYMLRKQQKSFISSWAIRWTYAHFKHQAYCLHLVKSKVHNIGTDNSGTHLAATKKYHAIISEAPYQLPQTIEPDNQIIDNLKRFFKPSIYRKVMNKWLLR